MENSVAICQSCSMPMATEEMYGSNQDGTKNEVYCTYCYQEGSFINPDQTLEQMIETCAPFMVEDNPNLTLEEAKEQLGAYLPTLKRWQA